MTVTDRPLIPQELLFSAGGQSAPKVSPDGRRLAFVAPSGGAPNVHVRELEESAPEARAVTHVSGHGVREFRWTPDSRHVLYEQDGEGDENGQLYLCPVDGGEPRNLTPYTGVRVQVLGLSQDFPDTVCVGLNLDDPGAYDVYHLALSTGELRQVVRNEGFIRWVVDPDLRARAAVRSGADAVEVVVRDDESSSWRVVFSAPPSEAFQLMFDVFPMSLSADGRYLHLITAQDSDTTQLVRVTIATGATDVVTGHPGGDIMDVITDPATHLPQIVTVPTDRNAYLVCDPAVEADVAALRSLDRGDFSITSRDDADELWTVEFLRDDGPTAYYLYQRSTRTGTLLFESQPQLNDYELSSMEPFSMRARDGLTLHGYLSFPPGGQRRDLPAIVMLHGGPSNRDFWGFNPMVQFFTDRGYLVCKVNFRGSLGYGKAFFAAGNRQWARAMHHDVVDTIEWIAGQGYADRARIGLWGTSYGGYETLVAVTHDPDLVTCAVPVVAPVNLVTLLERIPPYWRAEREYFTTALGDPATEREMLWDRSPLRLAHQIKVPLLIFYGENDPRVTVDEAHQLAAALEEHGIDFEMDIVAGEGHSLGDAMSPQNRVGYLDKMERFFARHLGGRSSAAD